ncbi:MAG: sigma-54-dependent Fis family transcriptional regulator [bacterium]|nr:sigma-54-dependent Fis family transcriptional regulator [bacterium]
MASDGLGSFSQLHVLVADADPRSASAIRQALAARDGAPQLVLATTLRGALGALRGPRVACIVTDVHLPDAAGEPVVRRLRQARPDVPILACGDDATAGLAVEALKQGAVDFVRKPLDAADVALRLEETLGRAVLAQVDQAGGLATPAASASVSAPADFVATSPAMRQVLLLAERAARSNVPVLLEGETGTGKEVLARAVHAQSARRGAPFVAQNCGALSETLLESELFGHVRGAFTGAERDRNGLFAEAGEGTVFLDEIGEAPPAVQVKLLRVLQGGEVKAVGADRAYSVRARIVAATNRALGTEVEAGRFRRDLYYRLAVFPIRVPPLRHRAAEVPELAARFLARCEREERRQTGGFTPEALDALVAYPWPGNVRELEHEVHRLVLTVPNDQRIRPHHLASRIRDARHAPQTAEPLARLMARVELALIRQRLQELPTKAAAARSLGITREALYGKLRRLGLPTRGRA